MASLAVLVQYRLVKFQVLETNENLAEYSLLHDKVLLFLRYPRYVYFIQKKFGNSSALLVEELLKSGVEVAQSVIIRSYAHSEAQNDQVLKEFRDAFLDLVADKYFIRSPEVTEDPVPQLKINIQSVFRTPELDLKELKSYIESGSEPVGDVYWTVNFDSFHQQFRDKILVDAIERQIDSNAGECFQFILQLMYNKTDIWAMASNPISFVEIKQIVERKSTNSDLVKYVEQYVSIIEKDECGFLKKHDEAGGGLYSINMTTAFKQLAWATIENVITQKFGSKATRIFRVVRAKKFIEQEDIQREAMIPGKEAKLFTYKLLEENFLQIQTIKKAGGGGMGPAKAFYLFRINQNHVSLNLRFKICLLMLLSMQIVLTLIETCYKALYNAMTRAIQDKEANRRLTEKSMRLQFMIDTMRERGESEDVINEINETITPPEKQTVEKSKARLKKLDSAEVAIDEMLLLLQLFIYFQAPLNK